MISRIADEIAVKIAQNVSWIDKAYGIVKPVKSKRTDGIDKVEPVYFNTDRNLCNGADYVSLAPDSSKKSMCYFELLTSPVVNDSGRKGTAFTVNLTAVVWFNYNKINIGMIDTDVLVADFLQSLPETLKPDGYYNRVLINVTGVEINNGNIFKKYTYNEHQQFLMYPYDYFTVNMEINYTIPKGCLVLGENPDECNLKPTIVVVDKTEVENNDVIKY